jgi:hypothetical protein
VQSREQLIPGIVVPVETQVVTLTLPQTVRHTTQGCKVDPQQARRKLYSAPPALRLVGGVDGVLANWRAGAPGRYLEGLTGVS